MVIEPLYVVSGFVVGMLVGMTGVGGGSLMTPLLILVFGVHPGTAVGTDLLYAAATKSGGTAVHSHNGTVDWRMVGRLALGSVPASGATMLVLAWLGLRTDAANTTITTALGFALVLTALALIFRGRLVARFGGHAQRLTERQRTAWTVATGAVLGVLVTISSVGAGAIGVTALVLLHPDMPAKRIVGSDIVHAVPLTLVAGLGHWLVGSINVGLLCSLLVGSLPGIVLGSQFSSRVPDAVLRPIIAATLLLVGGRMMLF